MKDLWFFVAFGGILNSQGGNWEGGNPLPCSKRLVLLLRKRIAAFFSLLHFMFQKMYISLCLNENKV